MTDVWLVCEGKTDRPVLENVFTRVLPTGILIRSAGGCDAIPSVAAYLAQENTGTVATAFVVDRDYARRDVVEKAFKDGKRRFRWRRHSIENYLLEPAIVVHALTSIINTTPKSRQYLLGSVPNDNTTIASELYKCAQARAPQEAGRMAFYRLWEDLSDTAGRIDNGLPTALSLGSPDVATCRQALIAEAARIIQKANETSACTYLAPLEIQQRYDDELARITADGYMSQSSFLEEFHGRDLLAAFHERLKETYDMKLSREKFTEALRDAVHVVYSANRLLYGTDDFLDLANGVRALAGLPALT